MRSKVCSYCGARSATDREHVFPACLYPVSKAASTIQRLTIPACRSCNGGWADDEAHFRNVLALSGEPNSSRRELWETTVSRSFQQPDGPRRVRDLAALIQRREVNGEIREVIFPGTDPRVLRVVRKVVRGLSHHHALETAVPDNRIWADVMKYEIPKEFLDDMAFEHREADIAQYRYSALQYEGIRSAWLITFFEQVQFIALVFEDGLGNEVV